MLSMVNMHLRFLSNHLLLLAFLIFFIQYGYEILNRNSFSVFSSFHQIWFCIPKLLDHYISQLCCSCSTSSEA